MYCISILYVCRCLCTYIVAPSPKGSRHLVGNYRKGGIFLGLQTEVGKQAAPNPKIEIL